MNYDELECAIEDGHKASSVLQDVLRELLDEHSCPEAAGFEGRETFPNCGKCVYCYAIKLRENQLL